MAEQGGMPMPVAGDIRPGHVVQIDNKVYRVVEVDSHLGGGRMGGLVKMRLEDIETAGLTEKRFRPEDKLEIIDLEKKHLSYLYADGETLYFMDPSTYEQYAVPQRLLGKYFEFLKDGEELVVEFLGERPVRVLTPKMVKLKVASTGPPQHAHETSVWKEAVLENGMRIQVPLFIATGDTIILDVEAGKYHDRER